MKHKTNWLAVLLCAGILLGAAVIPRGRAAAQSRSAESFSSRIPKIMARPEFRHASFGIEIYSLDKGKPLFALDGDKLFTPASTTKLLTEGTVLESLGADYRFHTVVYRSGDVDSAGTLKGDLILVASGDPNLSSRVRPDGTLAFRDHDHAYGGSPKTQAVPGDPLQVIRELVRQVKAHGVKRVEGRVLVDTSLFPDAQPELGTGVIVSSISVNDNVIDITVGPGPSEGAPATISVAPAIPLTAIVNQVVTGARNSKPAMAA